MEEWKKEKNLSDKEREEIKLGRMRVQHWLFKTNRNDQMLERKKQILEKLHSNKSF